MVPEDDILMNSYQWTCPACKTPNIFIHDTSVAGQVSLNCKQCGEPGVFEEDKTITMSPGYPEISVMATGMDTNATSSSDTPPPVGYHDRFAPHPSIITSLQVSEEIARIGKPKKGFLPKILRRGK